jgi:hypothetical protein
MRDDFESTLGAVLYRLLPAIYRERDNGAPGRPGDLARVLDAAGLLLDRVRGTLEQRLADAFPDGPDDDGGRAGQDWLLPYFARLFDARLVAPDVAGQRAEVQHAVAWRQRKGTLVCAEQIGAALLQGEVALREGWRGVALTPRLAAPRRPASAYGWTTEPTTGHPDLPSVTPDLRRHALALRTRRSGSAVQTDRLGDASIAWLQAGQGGVPRHAGAFDDPARRTVDLRTPSWQAGHAHPRRLLVHAAPPQGLFAPPLVHVAWPAVAAERVLLRYDALEHHLHVASRSAQPVAIGGDVDLLAALTPAQRAALPAGDDGRTLPRVTVEGLQFEGAVTLARGRLIARRVSMARLVLATNDHAAPVLEARDSLFGTLHVDAGRVCLDACTVRGDASVGSLEATNTLFAGALAIAPVDQPVMAPRLVRCRVPAAAAVHPAPSPGALAGCTFEAPVFFAVPADEAFGPAHAVLAPMTPASICKPADGGAEIGCFHRGRAARAVHLRAAQAVQARDHGYVLRDLVFESTLAVDGSAAPLLLARCAVAALALEPHIGRRTGDELVATDTLFGHLAAAGARVQLEYCTVLGAVAAGRLHASDCIFAGALDLGGSHDHCIRWSRVPPSNTRQPRPRCSTDTPVFIERDFTRGTAGCGVLHPATPASVSGGAEDGSEMGAGHAFAHVLQRAALADKLADHLPVGIEAVLIQDPRLLAVPPFERA